VGQGADRVTDTRLTLRQAAAALGVSESAIRKRVARGTLRSDIGPDGRRYVYLDTVADILTDEGADAAPHERNALISELRSHNDTLREQLEAERQAHAEARRIIAGLVERIPAIAAPQEPSEVAEADEEDPERSEPRPDAADPQTLQVRSPGARPGGEGDAATDGRDTFRGLSVWAYWLGVILTGMTGFLMQSGVGYRSLQRFAPGLPESDALRFVSEWGLPLLLPIVFGYLVGRRPRGSNFWRHVGVTALLAAAVSFLPYAIFTIPQVRSSLLTSNEPTTISFQVTQMWLPVPWLPVALAFLSSALIGNANRRRVAGPTPAAGFASKHWSPLALTLMGTAGNILAAVIIGIFALAGT
jgi:hypothetical protein